MNLYMAVALPVFFLTLQPQEVYSKEKPVTTYAAPKPQSRISFGSGIDLIVKGLGLNIDNIRFIKAPKASDYFKLANDKASYAQSLIIAGNNGIESGRDRNPESSATREQFALALYEAITAKNQYPVNMMWLIIKDEKSFTGNSLNAVQTLIKFKVVALENGNFRPKAYITKSEATAMVKNAAAFIASHKETAGEGQPAAGGVTFTATPVNDQVNSVVLSAGSKPTGGYELHITRIDFTTGNEAIIHYKLSAPAPGSMNIQVITEPKAETFVGTAYKVTLQEE
ncbi:protease complex subunit PrcB family protein [Chitinophaga sp.]|uniref:protease complex subunit PrcB family protein n=1 Tax=Chitinophaga sp. TaxID=1869181 RepID=UPI002F9374BA